MGDLRRRALLRSSGGGTEEIGYAPGVYAYYSNGSLKTYEDADTNAIGVAVISPICQFVIDKLEASSSAVYYGGFNKDLSAAAIATSNQDKAGLDFNGEQNTINIINACAGYNDGYVTGAAAAVACRAMFGGNGYMASSGEWRIAYNNKSSIVSMMSKIGGAIVGTGGGGYYLSSTLYSASTAYWTFGWSDGVATYNSRRYTGYVRAFLKIEVPVLDYVDLGLPSGNLWCTGNILKDASGGYHVGNATDYGSYYSWGNIVGHHTYDGYNFNSSNYNSTPGASLSANIPSNDAAHDAALANLGDGYNMPTKAQFEELIANCTSTWVTSYNGVSVSGRIFKSNISGYTDREIFIPASGKYDGTTLDDKGSNGSYWSSTYHNSSNAYRLTFSSSNAYMPSNSRFYGFSVRAVKNRPTLFKVSTTDGSSKEGITFMLSDDTNVCTYKTDANGKAKVYAPQGTYTVSSTYWTLSINSITLSGQKKVGLTATKIGDELVDLGLSVLWASGNICKSGNNYYVGNSTDKGCYFSWGNIEGHNEGDGYDFSSSTYQSTPGYTLTSDISDSDASHDAALACLGTGYRMPTKAEYDELLSNCTTTWVTSYNGVAVAGRIFKSKKAGYTDAEIFIPASGNYNGTTLDGKGSNGSYWSSTYHNSSNAYRLTFSSSNAYMPSNSRFYGFSVRAVKSK